MIAASIRALVPKLSAYLLMLFVGVRYAQRESDEELQAFLADSSVAGRQDCAGGGPEEGKGGRGTQSERVGFLLHRFYLHPGSMFPALDHGQCLHNKLAHIYRVQLLRTAAHLRAKSAESTAERSASRLLRVHVPHFAFFCVFRIDLTSAGWRLTTASAHVLR